MSKITLSFMKRFMGKLDTAIKHYVSDKLDGYAKQGTIFSQTLTAGSTSVTFTNLPTTGNYIFEVYTSMIGLDYVSASASSGQQTYTYEPQNSAVIVYLKVEEV